MVPIISQHLKVHMHPVTNNPDKNTLQMPLPNISRQVSIQISEKKTESLSLEPGRLIVPSAEHFRLHNLELPLWEA